MRNTFRNIVESSSFGVCTWLGNRMGIPSTTIRKYFIYASCLTLGSPVIAYLFTAFWLNIREYLGQGRRNPLRYL